jgi:hypothetical protein
LFFVVLVSLYTASWIFQWCVGFEFPIFYNLS